MMTLAERRHRAARALRVEVGQRLHEIAAHRAAEAAGVEQHHVLRRRGDEQVVDADLAELVDDDRAVARARAAAADG